MKKFVYFVFIVIILISCGPSPKFISPNYRRPARAAILPTINETADVNGSIIFRNIFYQQMEKKKYTDILDITYVDSILNEEGITVGGQLGSISQDELYKTLNADGLFYIKLLNCETTPTYRKVKANFKLYRNKFKLIWEDEREEYSNRISSPSCGCFTGSFSLRKFINETLITDELRLVLEHDLKPEMDILIKNSIKTMP
jgi:hypothetical protein